MREIIAIEKHLICSSECFNFHRIPRHNTLHVNTSTWTRVCNLQYICNDNLINLAFIHLFIIFSRCFVFSFFVAVVMIIKCLNRELHSFYTYRRRRMNNFVQLFRDSQQKFDQLLWIQSQSRYYLIILSALTNSTYDTSIKRHYWSYQDHETLFEHLIIWLFIFFLSV